MAIKKMEFTKGEDLNIRSNPRIENKIILENINELMQDENKLIVKCGKSYWDVSAAPHIFEQADTFNISELTGIERKEMQQTTVPAHAYSEKTETVADPMSILYQKTEEEEEEPEYVVRKTYYMSELAVEVISTYCYKTGSEISEAVRELILRGAPEDVLEKAKERVAFNQSVRPKTPKRTKKKRIVL